MIDSEAAAPASAIAHELRTPLAVIRGYAELLRVRDDDRTRTEAADRILEAVGQLSELVDDVVRRLAHTWTARSDELDTELGLAASRARLTHWVDARNAAAPEVPSKICRVLLADDDAALRSLLRTTLPVEGFEVVEARDGDDALEQAAAAAPDLVVLDWNMPGRSGASVLEELHRERPGLPVIVLTGDATGSSRALASSLGASTFLAKPFSPLELLEAIESLLPACV